ncbi:N-terminal nucleophile aminohydrolases superfamily protein, partial [Prunus dulcis]
RRPGHHRPSRSPPWVPSGPPPCHRQDLTDLNPGAALSWPENHAPGVQLTHGKDLRRVQLARTICHRSARDPPPGHSQLPCHQVENFGIGQNTEETLPNFRQKSKGNFKENLLREG